MQKTENLYHIYFQSDSSQCRELEPELNGVIRLTDEQVKQLEEVGNVIQSNDAGRFELEPITPYTFEDVREELAPFGIEEAV